MKIELNTPPHNKAQRVLFLLFLFSILCVLFCDPKPRASLLYYRIVVIITDIIIALPLCSTSFSSIVCLDFCHVDFFPPLTSSWWGFSCRLAHSDERCLLLLNSPIVPVYLAETFVSAKVPTEVSSHALESIPSKIKTLWKECCCTIVLHKTLPTYACMRRENFNDQLTVRKQTNQERYI